jgi:hypothetical protein
MESEMSRAAAKAAPKKASTKVKFGTPPEPRVPRYDWEAIAQKLRDNPGEWACIFEGDKTSLVTAIRIRGIKPLLPEKGFEVRTTNNIKPEPGVAPRTCDLWLRYVPSKDKVK